MRLHSLENFQYINFFANFFPINMFDFVFHDMMALLCDIPISVVCQHLDRQGKRKEI